MASFKNLISTTSAQISSGGTITGDLVINGDLQVDGGGSLSFDEIVQGTQVIDVTNTEALLVRKNDDGGDVFVVDTTNSRVGINSTPSRTFQVDGTASATTATGYFYTNAIHTGVDTQSVVSIRSDNASSTGNVLHVQGDGTGNLLTLSKDGSDKLTVTHEGNSTFAGDITTNERLIFGGTNDSIVASAITPHSNGFIYIAGGSGGLVIGDDATSSRIQIMNDAEIKFEVNGSERMRIDGSGNVGIGVTDIPSALMITRNESSAFNGSTDDGQAGVGSTITVSNDSTSANSFAQLNFQVSASSGRGVARIVGIREASQTSSLAFVTENSNTASEAMRITGSGNVGIGTASPTSKLSVSAGRGANTGLEILDSADSNNKRIDLRLDADGDGYLSLVDASETTKVQLYSNGVSYFNGGNVGIGTTSPDYQLELEKAGGGFLSFKTTDTEIVNNDVLGTIQFGADDATASGIDIGAKIVATATDNFQSASSNVDAPTKLEFFTQDNTTTDVMSTVGATLTLGGDDQNATFAGKVAISSDFNAGELLGVKGSAGSEWGARIDNTSSTGYGALVKSGGTSSSQLLFQVRGGSVNALTIRGDSSSTFAGDVKITKVESSASEFISALEINRDYGSTTTTDLLTGIIFTDDNSVQAGIFTNRYNSANYYNSKLQFYVNNGASSMTPQTALGDPSMIIDGDSRISLSNNDSGTSNTVFGKLAGDDLDSGGNYNSLFGESAGHAITTGDGNVIMGHTAGQALTTGVRNVLLGRGAGLVTTNAQHLIGIGFYSLSSVNSADASGAVAVGYESLKALTSGASNTAVGYESLTANQQGDYNTAIGYEALETNIDGGDNTAVGYRALALLDIDSSDTSPSYNTAVGARALDGIQVGVKNTVIGADAMGSADDNEDNNTAIGYKAMFINNNGFSNTCIGSEATLSAAAGQGQIAIGKGVSCIANETATIGFGSNVASLGLDGSDTSWAASSDERLKENIVDSTAGLDVINDLRPVTYNWKKAKDIDKSMPQYKDSDEPVLGKEYGESLHGFIAQEVKVVIDKHDSLKEGFKMWKQSDDGTQTIADGNLIPILVKAVQELSAKVKELESK